MTDLYLTHSPLGIVALTIFVIAYVAVIFEERLHLRKSKPVVFAAGLIWVLLGIAANQTGQQEYVLKALQQNLYDYTELFLFLLVAMTYINALEERLIFAALKGWLVRKGFGYKAIFWLTGFIAFFLSPIADNMTTALVLCAVVMAIANDNRKFIAPACVNVVVAVNAGGAFSPFGDITTLMVWQKQMVEFHEFFYLFFPAVINFIIPAFFLSFAIPDEKPPTQIEQVRIKVGGLRIAFLFLMTILTAIGVHHELHFPPAFGMMLGLSYLQFLGFYIKRKQMKTVALAPQQNDNFIFFDVFKKIQRIEWDTLLFFYGVMLCVGGLAVIGYLAELNYFLYINLGQSLPPHLQALPANILIGLISSLVDNIPVMFAILTMHPNMSLGQWLLVTLATGVGGSLLSIGSAAGVALMGQSKGYYTFFSHLKWSWAILLGYIASIALHCLLNYQLF